jgi:hypothetical protein
MTRAQARDLISEAPIAKELPDLTAGLMFNPYGFGYVGTPICFSSDPRVTCYPQGPGPDDDPRGFVCVCFGPDLQDDDPQLGGGGGIVLPEPCVLEFQQTKRGRFVLGCRKQRCSQNCRLNRLSSIGRWILGCTCGP